ncbi:MAG: DUF2085 domain-containing protein [Rubrivivax sp.]
MGIDPGALFAFVCGQIPEHTWAPGGMPLHVCQRCTGLYAGAAVALLLHALLRLRPSDRMVALHAVFLLPMVPLGYHWLPQDGLARTLSGILFGAGVVDFLWVNPARRIRATRLPDRADWGRYVAALAITLVAVPLLALRGDARAAWLLDALAVAGFAALVLLVLANLALALRFIAAPGGSRGARAAPPARRDPRGAAPRR